MKISQFLDATYLKTAAQAGISEQENLNTVLQLLEDALLYDYKLIMIRDNYVAVVKKRLVAVKSNVLIGTVIDFPEGKLSIEEKLQEAQRAIDLGADELDIVINYAAFREGNTNLKK
jgi:deoxyribose-phosphate aldolase